MNRSHNSSFNSSDFNWGNSSIQDRQSDRNILELIEKIRNCKPYLQKRLKVIEESGQLKLLREEVKDIKYWLEIAQEVRADIIYGVETLEVVHEKMMEMIRINPLQGVFATNQLGDSDDDSDSAPRSPSPGLSSNDFSSSTRIIPLEKSQSDNDYGRPKGFLPDTNVAPNHRISISNEYNSPRSESRFHSDWGSPNPSATNLEFSRRGDTDMRIDRLDSYNPAPTRPFGRGRGLCIPTEGSQINNVSMHDNRNNSSPSPWTKEAPSPWDTFRSVDIRPQSRSRERGEDNSRDYDYRESARPRERCPDGNRFRDPTDRSRDNNADHDRGRNFYGDQDLRDYNRGQERSRDRERSSDSDRSRASVRGSSPDRSRSRPHERRDSRDWSRHPESSREHDRSFDRSRDGDDRGYVYRDRESRERNRNKHQDYHRSDFEKDNRDSWSHSSGGSNSHNHVSAQNSSFSSPDSNLPSLASFMMGQQPLMGMSPQSPNVEIMSPIQNMPQRNVNRQQQHSNFGISNHAIPPQSPTLGVTSQTQSRNPSFNAAVGQHSPQTFHNSFQHRANTPRQPLLPTPVNRTTMPNPFSDPYQSAPNQGNSPRPSMNTLFDSGPRQTAASDFANQFRQKAQQHFAKTPRPRVTSHPRHPGPPSIPRPPPPVAANSTSNPNLATNQIAADLPSDPRRRSQLQRQMQQQQQAQISPNPSMSPLDPRKRPPSPKEKDKVTEKDSSVSGSPVKPTKRREGCTVSENSTLKNSMKEAVERVRGVVAKDIPPKTSKLQELKKSFAKQGYVRLGTKNKNKFEEAESPEKRDSDKESRTSVNKNRDKTVEETKGKKQYISPTRSHAKGTKEVRGKNERVTRTKDRRTSLHSDEDEVDNKKRGTSSSGTDDDVRDSRRRTRRSVVTDNEETPRRGSMSPRKSKSPSKSKSEEPVIVCPKINTSFRIPKIKKPPPPPEPEVSPVDDESPLSPMEISPPQSPEPPVGCTEAETLMVLPTEIPSSPKPLETEAVKKPAESQLGASGANDTSEERVNSSSENAVDALSEKNDTNLLLRQFMVKSIGLSGDVLEQIISNPSAMEKIKSLLKNHVSEIVSKDHGDASHTDNPDSALNKMEDEDEESTAQEIIPTSSCVNDEGSIRCRSRSVTRRKSHKRRSSLEKLHDALREMNFDAVLPLGPRRATNRTLSEETSTPAQPTPMDTVAESIQNVIDNVIEFGKEDLNPVAQPPEVSTEYADQTNNVLPEKGKRGRKRKAKANKVVVEKKRGRKPGLGGGVSVSAKAAIAAVAAIPDIEVNPSGNHNSHNAILNEENTIEESESDSMPSATTNTTVKKRGRKPLGKSLVVVEAPKSPTKKKSTTPTKALRPVPVRELNPDGRVTRSMIKPPAIQINTALNKVKVEADFLPLPIVPKFEPLEMEEILSEVCKTATTPEKRKSIDKGMKTKVKIKSTEDEHSEVETEDIDKGIQIIGEVSDDEKSEIETESVESAKQDCNMNVFLYDSKEDINARDYISSHDKLLSEAGTRLIVKPVLPEKLLDFIETVLPKAEKLEPEVTVTKDDTSTEKITKDCSETIEWMLSVLQFKSSEDVNGIDSDFDPNQDVSDLYDISTSTETQIPVSKCMVDIFDYEDDDEDELCENGNEDSQMSAVVANNGDVYRGHVSDSGSVSDYKGFAHNEEDDSNFAFSDTCPNNIFSKDDSEDINGNGGSPRNDEEDNIDSRRKSNMAGTELYRCSNPNCGYQGLTATVFKEHCINCKFTVDGKLQCFHCERRLKSIVSLMEHLKIHGKPRQYCGLCDFRGWFGTEISKHIKNVHKVYNLKVLKEGNEDEDPIHVTYPKEVANRLTLPKDLLQTHILYTSKVQFQPSEIDSVPKSCIFTSLLHCAVCDYATKVRSNIIRHLKLHITSENDGGTTQVPNTAPVNPVPCLERKELMFDKMTNWAGSSHANKIGGVSKEDTLRLPKFVTDQFRYVCSVDLCKHITTQDDILCAHMKALHFDEKFYRCPHCQDEEGTRDDPRNTVLIERIPHHLKLHGPRLSKCGHCDYIHYSSTSMEKHVATKHIEKKPIFYLIRDLDSDGNNLTRRASVEDAGRAAYERWRCTLCRANLSCWEDAKNHTVSVHKVKNQFECSYCHFGSDSIYAITSHITKQTCLGGARILVAFLRNEAFEGSDTKVDEGINVPIWRRDALRVKHIRGIFLDDEHTKPSYTNKNSQNKAVPAPSTSTNIALAVPKPPMPPLWLICPKCNLYKSKTAIELRIHLFNEFNYQRYKCNLCEIRFVTVDSLKAHMTLDHKVTVDDEAKSMLPIIEKIENEVYDIISDLLNTHKANAEDKDGRNIENLLCKHCYLQFSSFHNYRTHILAKHIGSERFKCKYCNAGFWHEAMVKQHHFKSTHADKPLQVIRNNEFEQMLTPEFWFQEYGIPHNKSINSASIGRPGDEDESASPSKYLKCGHCEFKTDSFGTLQSHQAYHRPENARKTYRRRISTTSDTDKDDIEDNLKPSSPKKIKNYKELSTVYKCDHCMTTNFTKRGIRSHWSRSHGMEELPCRYYECKSFDDNFKLTDGYVLKCSTCTFQTASVEHYQAHHDVDHPGKSFRFKRKKRNQLVKSTGELADVLVCNYCHCELENITKMESHNEQKHKGCRLDYKMMAVHTTPQCDTDVSTGKLIEEGVTIECSTCHKKCATLKKYLNHFTSYHDSQAYVEPNIRFTRVYGSGNGESELMDIMPSTTSTATRGVPASDLVRGNYSNNPEDDVTAPQLSQTKTLYKCPKCDFKSENYDLLCSNHLITHLLAYRCPECNLAFHLLLDAQFHIRHFHGIPRIRASHNGDAYIEFSALKDQIIQVTISNPINTPPPSRKNVILVNLSDEEDFDDPSFPIPNAEDLDELDVEDVRLLLE